MSTPKRLPTTYVVPAGARPVRCKHCPASFYFTPPLRVPIDCSTTAFPELELQPPTAHEGGLGINHFITCPGRDAARRAR